MSMVSKILKESDIDEEGGVIRWQEETDEVAKREQDLLKDILQFDQSADLQKNWRRLDTRVSRKSLKLKHGAGSKALLAGAKPRK